MNIIRNIAIPIGINTAATGIQHICKSTQVGICVGAKAIAEVAHKSLALALTISGIVEGITLIKSGVKEFCPPPLPRVRARRNAQGEIKLYKPRRTWKEKTWNACKGSANVGLGVFFVKTSIESLTSSLPSFYKSLSSLPNAISRSVQYYTA